MVENRISARFVKKTCYLFIGKKKFLRTIVAGHRCGCMSVKQMDCYSDGWYMLQISLELVAIDEIVAASSPWRSVTTIQHCRVDCIMSTVG